VHAGRSSRRGYTIKSLDVFQVREDSVFSDHGDQFTNTHCSLVNETDTMVDYMKAVSPIVSLFSLLVGFLGYLIHWPA